MNWLVIVNPDGRVRRIEAHWSIPNGWTVVSERHGSHFYNHRGRYEGPEWMALPLYDPDEDTEVFVAVDPAKSKTVGQWWLLGEQWEESPPTLYHRSDGSWSMDQRKGERRNLADQLGVIQTMSGEYLYVFDLPGGLMCIDRRKSDRRKAGK